MSVSLLSFLAIGLGLLGLLAAVVNAVPPPNGDFAIAGAILFSGGLLARTIAEGRPPH